MKQLLPLVIIICCGLLTVSCGSETSEPAANMDGSVTVKIGVILPMSGDVATYGEECWNGLQLAMDEVKSKLDKKIELILCDNKGDPTESEKSAMQLITVNKVVAILGSVCSRNTKAGSKIANENCIPMITPASTADKLTVNKEYLSRICFIDSFQGGVMAEFAANNLGLKKAAIAYDRTNDYSVGLTTSFKDTFEKLGGKVVTEENFNAGDTDFSALISRIAAAQPQCVFIPAYYSEVGTMMKQSKGAWDSFVLLGGDGWDSPDLYKLASQTKGGNYMTTHFAPDDNDKVVQEFVKKYNERYNKMPGAMAALGYDTGYAIYHAIKLTAKPTPAEIQKAITEKLDFQGVTGKIKMNSEHNVEKEIVILEVTPTGSKFKTKIAYKKY
ncbi:MAG: ABC transporter substrate-binding protein [Planctomycetota bacterium]